MIKAIFFDLGKVLLEYEFELAAWRLTGGQAQASAALAEFFESSQAAEAFNAGKLTPEEYFEILQAAFPITIPFERFAELFTQIFSESEVGLKLLERVKKHYPVFVVSNINVLHARYVERAFPLFGSVKDFVCSCDLGACKPDPAIFQAAVKRAGVLPEEIFYTDDKESHVQAACALGLKGVVYRPDEPAMKDLMKSAGVEHV